jgi:hypothetical protein
VAYDVARHDGLKIGVSGSAGGVVLTVLGRGLAVFVLVMGGRKAAFSFSPRVSGKMILVRFFDLKYAMTCVVKCIYCEVDFTMSALVSDLIVDNGTRVLKIFAILNNVEPITEYWHLQLYRVAKYRNNPMTA